MSKLKVKERDIKSIQKFYDEILKIEDLDSSRTLVERVSSSGDTTGTPFYHFRWKYHNLADVIIYPESSDQIKRIIQLANEYNISLTPRGAGSCYYGSGIPTNGGAVLDMKRMNSFKINEENLTVRTEPGIVFTHLQDLLARKGYTLGCYPTSAYTTTIGGWIGTGGTMGVGTLQSGTFIEQVKELTLVDPQGKENVFTTRKEIKNFFGVCGIFGIITELVLKIYPLPNKQKALMFGINNLKNLLDIVLKLTTTMEPFVIRFSDRGHEYRSTGFSIYKYYLFIIFNGKSKPLEEEIKEAMNLIQSDEYNGKYLGDVYSQNTWDNYLKHEMKIKLDNPVLMLQQIYTSIENVHKLIDKFETLVSKAKLNHAYYGIINKDKKVRLVFYTPTDNEYWLHFLASKATLHKVVKYAYQIGGRVYTYGLQNTLYLKKFEKDKYKHLQNKKQNLDPNYILNPLKVVFTKMNFSRIDVMFNLAYFWRVIAVKLGLADIILTPNIPENYDEEEKNEK